MFMFKTFVRGGSFSGRKKSEDFVFVKGETFSQDGTFKSLLTCNLCSLCKG